MVLADEFTRGIEGSGWRNIGIISAENTLSGYEAQCYQFGDGGDERNGFSSLRIEKADSDNFHIMYSQTSGKKVFARRDVISQGLTAFREGDLRLELMKPDLELSGQIVRGVPNEGAIELFAVVGFA